MRLANDDVASLFNADNCLYICGQDPHACDKCIFRCVFWDSDKFSEVFEGIYRRIKENEVY